MPCVYCGIKPGATRDHVPPKCLFARRPHNLVTVPCCEGCRKTQSGDDEYFKAAVVLRHDVAEHPAAKDLTESVQRALTYEHKQGFARSLLGNTQWVDVHSLAGLYLGRRLRYHPRTRRLDAVVRRTLLGLYFRKRHERLPDTHRAVVLSCSALGNLDMPQQATMQRMIELALTGEVHEIGDRVFRYAYHQNPGVPHSTLWLFSFFERVNFVGVTDAAEKLPPLRDD